MLFLQNSRTLRHASGFLISAALCLLLSACHAPEQSQKQGAESQTKNPQTTSRQDSSLKVVKVELRRLTEKMPLPGNLEAYQDVKVHGKVEGFITWIGVDRASFVHKGQPLIRIAAPELDQKCKEAAAKVITSRSLYNGSIESLQSNLAKRKEAQEKLDADKLTFERLTQAAKVPGAVAENEVDVAEKTMEEDESLVNSFTAAMAASKALIDSRKADVAASESVYNSLLAMKDYLVIKAPFDGVITERNVHPGAIVAISPSRDTPPLLRIKEISKLRLVVAVPEGLVSGIKKGTRFEFTVPAYPGKDFYGTLTRPAYSLDLKTRTMPVELDVPNDDLELQPGMFATVNWELDRPYETMFLPDSAVGEDLNGNFVDKIVDGKTQRVSVQKGLSMDNDVEVMGALKPGDEVLQNANGEFQDGTPVQVKLAGSKPGQT